MEQPVNESPRDGTTGRLIVSMFMTLDQTMQGPGQPHEEDEGGFVHGGWHAPFADAENGRIITEQILEMDALLLGSGSFRDGAIPAAFELAAAPVGFANGCAACHRGQDQPNLR